MVSRTILIGLLTLTLTALSLSPAQAAAPPGHPGPHVGLVAEGQTNPHVYSSDVLGNPCIPLMAQFIVTLEHVPTADTLRVEVLGASADSVEGRAVATFYSSWCSTFTIDVTGVDVHDVTFYRLTVERVAGA